MKTKPLARALAVFALGICVVVSASAQSVTKGPEMVVKSFVDAWNAHDMTAFGDLMTADADWVTASGSRLSGREKIRAYLAEEHATWAKTTSMVSSNIYVRHMNRTTAMVFFEWQIKPAKDAADARTRRGNNLFIATQYGSGWIIATGHVARRSD